MSDFFESLRRRSESGRLGDSWSLELEELVLEQVDDDEVVESMGNCQESNDFLIKSTSEREFFGKRFKAPEFSAAFDKTCDFSFFGIDRIFEFQV